MRTTPPERFNVRSKNRSSAHYRLSRQCAEPISSDLTAEWDRTVSRECACVPTRSCFHTSFSDIV
eukprot:6176431-Pleurochrysis_carterae.AAC.1